MRKTVNIDFDNSSSVLLGYDADILGGGTTKYALLTHTHGDISDFGGTNITMVSSGSHGLSLSVAPPSAAINSVYVTGSYLTRSTLGISTTLGITGVANITHTHSDYLTTAALSNHVHGGAPSITGNIGGTIGIGGWSLSEPGFLLTAAASDHTHSDKAGTGTTVGATAGTLFKVTANSDGLNFSVPNYITTAAQSDHTHGTFAGTNISRVYSSTDGLRLSVASSMGTNTSSNTVSGTDFIMTGNNLGLTLSMPKFITTQEFTEYGSNYVLSGFSSTSVDSRGIPYGLSVTAQPGNLLSLSDGGAGSLTSSGASGYILISSGTAMLVGSDNITLVQDGNRIAFMGAASGTDAGVAFSLSTSNTSGTLSLISSGTVYFQGGDNITLSQESNTVNIVGAAEGIVGISNSETMYTSGSLILSEYTNITISSSVDGTNQYFRFSVPDQGAAVNAVCTQTDGYLTLSTVGVNTSISVTGLFPSANTTKFAGTGTSMYNASATLNSVGLALSVHARQTGVSGIAGSGASTVTAGTVRFANLNGISFGLNGSTMTASYASNHTHGAAVSTVATAGTDVKFTSSSNGLTIGVPAYITSAGDHTHGSIYTVSSGGTLTDILNSSASSGVTLTIPPYAVTSHTHSNLYPNLTHIHGANILSFSNFYSSTTGSSSNSVVIGLTAYPSSSFVNVSDSGNVYFSNANGVTFGSASSGVSTTITADIATGSIYFVDSLGSNITWGTSTNGNSTSLFATAGGGTGAVGAYELEGANTAGTTSFTLGTKMYFSGGDNITLSGNSNTIIFSAGGGTGGGGAASFTLGGNIATGASSTVSGSQIQIIGGNNITLSAYDGTNLRLDGFSTPQGSLYYIDSNGISFGANSSGLSTTITASVNSGTVYFVDSNSFSFGSSADATNTTITGSFHPSYVSFIDSNGVSFGTATTGSTTNITAAMQPILFADIAGFSFTSSSTGTSTYWYLKTA